MTATTIRCDTDSEGCLFERVTARLRAEGGCSVFGGARNKEGYGIVKVGGWYWLAHRLLWTLRHGPIPDGMNVLHHCDNPPCCDDDHLFLGTLADNNRDRHSKGRTVVPPSGWGALQRAKTHCPQGHPYAGENLRLRPDGRRRCAACYREHNRARRQSA